METESSAQNPRSKRYSDGDKAKILAECGRLSMSAVARKYAVSQTSLKKWLDDARRGAVSAGPSRPANVRELVPAVVPEGEVEEGTEEIEEAEPSADRINVHFGEIVVEFPIGMDPRALAEIVRALRE